MTEIVDFIDFEGAVKDMPNLNNKDYAIHYLQPTTTYTILKIELDANTNDKRYVCLLNESRLNANMNSNCCFDFSIAAHIISYSIFFEKETINNLNTGKVVASKDKSKQTASLRANKTSNQPSSQSSQQTLNHQSMSTPNSMQSFTAAPSTTSVTKKKK